MQDCIEVKMDQICRCISHGDHSLGCVLPLTSSSFQKELSKVDVIISKGQGNYEGLYQENLSNIYYLMMVKCKIIANLTGYKVNDLVCMKGK